MKSALVMPIDDLAAIHPERNPVMLANITSAGITTNPASTRGRIRWVTGERPRLSSASPSRSTRSRVWGADPPRENEPREHRAELEDDGLGDDGAVHVQRHGARELVARLEARHRSREPRHEQHDEEGAVADGHRLPEGERQIDAPLGEPAAHVEDEVGEAAGVAGGAETPSPDHPPQVHGDLRTAPH